MGSNALGACAREGSATVISEGHARELVASEIGCAPEDLIARSHDGLWAVSANPASHTEGEMLGAPVWVVDENGGVHGYPSWSDEMALSAFRRARGEVLPGDPGWVPDRSRPENPVTAAFWRESN